MISLREAALMIGMTKAVILLADQVTAEDLNTLNARICGKILRSKYLKDEGLRQMVAARLESLRSFDPSNLEEAVRNANSLKHWLELYPASVGTEHCERISAEIAAASKERRVFETAYKISEPGGTLEQVMESRMFDSAKTVRQMIGNINCGRPGGWLVQKSVAAIISCPRPLNEWMEVIFHCKKTTPDTLALRLIAGTQIAKRSKRYFQLHTAYKAMPEGETKIRAMLVEAMRAAHKTLSEEESFKSLAE